MKIKAVVDIWPKKPALDARGRAPTSCDLVISPDIEADIDAAENGVDVKTFDNLDDLVDELDS